MKILFVSPARKADIPGFWDFRFSSFMHGRPLRVNPFLALPTLAALCPKDSEVRIVDEYITPVPFEDEFDLVGITANTALAMRAYEIADAFRARGQKVVLGGMHPSHLPDEAEKHADCVVIGEADRVFGELIADLKAGKLKKRYVPDGFCDLRDSPGPRWDLVPLESYSTPVVQTSRGCPYNCEFCSVKTFFGRKYRWKPKEAVLREIADLKTRGKDTFFWADDNLVANRKRLMEVLDEVKRLNVKFYAQVALDAADDPDLLESLAAAGCKRFIIGFESLSEENLRQMKKGKVYRPEEYGDQVRRIQGMGIEVLGSFIFGYDHDDPSVFRKTADFIMENGLSTAVLAVLTPYPGTPLYSRMEKEMRILTRDWSLYDCSHVCFQPTRMSPEELQEGYDWVRREVFSYDNIFKRLESLWGCWNEKGLRHWDRLSPLLVNLEAHSAAYGGPPFPESPIPGKAGDR